MRSLLHLVDLITSDTLTLVATGALALAILALLVLIAWPTRPAEVVRSANLIAVLFEVNPTQAERVRLAITAGAPQPYSAPPPQLPEMQAR